MPKDDAGVGWGGGVDDGTGSACSFEANPDVIDVVVRAVAPRGDGAWPARVASMGDVSPGAAGTQSG